MKDKDSNDDHLTKSYIECVLKRNMDIIDFYITECSQCKRTRLCQVFEADDGSREPWCEQCTWELSDEYFKEFYPDMIEGVKE